MEDDTAKNLCQKLAPEINEKKANALWLSYLLEDNKKDKEELVNQLQLLAVKKLGVDFKNDLILLPPSSKKDAYGKGHIYLGDIHYGRENGKPRKKYPLYVTLNEINHHILVSGMTGWGKTTIAQIIALQLLKLKIPFLVLENGSWRNILSLQDEYPEVKDIQIFTFGKPDLAPFLGNWIANPPPGVSLPAWIGIITSTPLEASELSGAGSGTYLEDLALELIKKFERGELDTLPNTELIKKLLMQDYNARGRKMLWRQTTERVLKSLTRESVFLNFNSSKPMDLTEILKKPTIIELSKEIPPKYRTLFKWLITLWIIVYRFRQGESDKLRHLLLFDDFAEMISSSKHEQGIGSNSISTLCCEIRKFGQGLLFSIQTISALSTEIIGNCRVQIHFSCNTKKDIEGVENALFLKPEQRHYLDLLDIGECIVKIKNRIKPCYVKFKKLSIKKGAITDKIIRERYNAGR